MIAQPIIKNHKTPYIIWIIPIIALIIAGWLYIKHQQERGSDIKVVFDNVEGIEAGKTKLMFNGFQLGIVKKIDINPENILQSIVTINVFPPADKSVAREGTQFFKIEPKVGITGISGLETLLSGSYIKAYSPETNTIKLQERPFKDYFIASKEEPIDLIHAGMYIHLESDVALVSGGAPILYNGLAVGRLLEAKMTQGKMSYIGLIEALYVNLLKKRSRFWVASGVELHASLAGVKLQVGSLANIIAGGVMFSSSEEDEVLSEGDKTPFKLYPSKESPSLDTQIAKLRAKKGFNLDSELNAIYYKGVKAGKIDAVAYDPKIDETTIRIRLHEQYTPLLNENAHFWIVEPKIDLKGVQGLDAIPQGAYLTFDSHIGGELKSEFQLHDAPPPKKGKTYMLTSDDIGGLKVGAPISMKGLETGTVTNIRFNKNMSAHIVDALIYEQFDKQINNSTMFYLKRAVELRADLKELSLKTGTLENFLIGGIEFETPSPDAKRSNPKFTLYGDRFLAQKALYLKSGGARFILESKSLASPKEGLILYYYEFPAGKVLGSHYNPKNDRSEIEIYIEPDFVDKIDSSAVFYQKSAVSFEASLSGVKVDVGGLDALIQGSIAFKNQGDGNSVKEGHRFDLHDNLYRAENSFVSATLKTEEAFGIRIGSAIKYKGLKIGEVKSQQLKDGYLETELLINEQFSKMLVQDTSFWVESFKADISGIKNADTAISGSEIHIMPGGSKIASTSFKLSSAAPPKTFGKDGLRIIATSSRRSSLDVGSPIYYRQVQIGQVESYRLSNNGNSVEFILFIEPCYKSLVRQNSIVYLPSAIGVDVSLFGVKIRTETVQTMVYGGIGIINPEESSPQAENKQTYKMEEDIDEKWYKWQSQSPVELECKQDI